MTLLDGHNNVLGTSYYRYYPGPGGYSGQDELMYSFSAPAYAQMVAALGSDVSSLTNAQVAPYADTNIDWVGVFKGKPAVSKIVTQGQGASLCCGCLGTYTYDYTASNNPPGFNSWAGKTVETLPDGNQNIVYTNAYGEVMLQDYHDNSTGLNSLTFYQYDDQGRLLLQANPSAVTGYNDSWPDLLGYQNGSYAGSEQYQWFDNPVRLLQQHHGHGDAGRRRGRLSPEHQD